MTSTDEPTPASRPELRGALSMIIAVIMFSLMDAAMKRLSESYSAVQVTCLRGVAAMPLLLVSSALRGRMHELRPSRWWLHLLRGALGFVTLSSFVWSVAQLSLAHTYSIFMSAPLWITALSWPLLRESVSAQRWVAVVLGLFGVVVALRPAGAGFTVAGGLGALVAALAYALSAITIRVQGRTESVAAIVFWGLLVTTLLSGVAAVIDWRPLRVQDTPWIVALGVTGLLAQHYITRAFQIAPPHVVAPLEYSSLLCGIALDALLWGVAPDPAVLAGASVVVGSGVYVIRSAARTE